MDKVIAAYFEAWNEPDTAQRGRTHGAIGHHGETCVEVIVNATPSPTPPPATRSRKLPSATALGRCP
jgi:hypothetical protein